MPFDVQIPLVHVYAEIPNLGFLSHIMGFPEFSRLGTEPQQNAKSLLKEIRSFIDDQPASKRSEIQRRWQTVDVVQSQTCFEVTPSNRRSRWVNGIKFQFETITRTNGPQSGSWIPRLGIEVLTDSSQDHEKAVEEQIRLLLSLDGLSRDLRTMVRDLNEVEIQFEVVSLPLHWQSLKATVRQEELAEGGETSVLKKVGNLIHQSNERTYGREEELERLAESLSGAQPESVLLIGSSGCGKTAIVRELARQRQQYALGKRSFWSTSGAKLVSGMTGFGMWQERCQQVVKEASSQNSILHVGSLVELMEVGQGESQNQGIAMFLRPYIARGELQVIAECTQEEFALIENRNPHLLLAFEHQHVSEPTPELEREILSQIVGSISNKVSVKTSVLDSIVRLHRRYATYSGNPGRSIRFLKNQLSDQPTDGQLNDSDVTSAFSRETGLPDWFINDDIPLNYETSLDWFKNRVLGQDSAVHSVVDLLAVLKAGLQRPSGPLGSFLFIGPTGVGKTELAKVLASFAFGSESRLIRIDMSEYADPTAIDRLIGGTFDSEGVLTAKIREQPFSVVLLDEFEKADHKFFDLLLQVLGEGRLTDSCGRVASFNNSIIIMTSNLGAEGFRRGSVGFSRNQKTDEIQQHFVNEVQRFVRPELYNRIDKIVPFAPIQESVARRILKRELEIAQQLDGMKLRKLVCEIDPSANEQLLEDGFEGVYGARSLKRALRSEILIPLSRKLIEFPGTDALTAEIESDSNQISVDVRRQHTDFKRERVSDHQLIETLQRLRFRWQKLKRCQAVQRLRDTLFQLERLEQKLMRNKKLTPAQLEKLATKEAIARLLNAVDEAGVTLIQEEDRYLIRYYQQLETSEGIESERHRLRTAVDEARTRIEQTVVRVHAWSIYDANRINLFLYGPDRREISLLCRAYLRTTSELGGTLDVSRIVAGTASRDSIEQENWNSAFLKWEPSKEKRPGSRTEQFDLVPKSTNESRTVHLRRMLVENSAKFFNKTIPAGTLGVILTISADLIRAKLEQEVGLHEIVQENGKQWICVESFSRMNDFLPPWRFETQGRPETERTRRVLNRARNQITDSLLQRTKDLQSVEPEEAIVDLIEQNHLRNAWSIIESDRI